MVTACVDRKKALDSVDREALWDILRLRGSPAMTVGLLTDLNDNVVKWMGGKGREGTCIDKGSLSLSHHFSKGRRWLSG